MHSAEVILEIPMDTFTYDRKKLLGMGAFASIYEGRYKGESVAVKRIQLVDISFDREIASHLKMDHENVVKMLDVIEDMDFK